MNNLHIAIILAEPQMGENIGSIARAMKNFNISDLRIIKPRDGWPNSKAHITAVGALNIVQNAKIYQSIEDATGDLEYLYAATANIRSLNKAFVTSKDLHQELYQYNRVGVIFGRENSGLTNQEISFANKIITINNNINFSSLNIAHAVSIICYEIFQHQYALDQEQEATRSQLSRNIDTKLATLSELEYFYKHLFVSLDSSKFFKSSAKKQHMMNKIRNIFNRVDNLSHVEIQTLRGVVNKLYQYKE